MTHTTDDSTHQNTDQRRHWPEIIFYFLKLGFLGFGGPLALMAAYQRDLIERRRWTSPERFAQGLALIKALPGPTATQLSIYMGQIRGGKFGGFLAGFCLILPSFILMVLLAKFYTSIEHLAWSKIVLFGMQSAALGVIAESVWNLARPYKKEIVFWIVALNSAVLTFLKPSSEPLVIIVSGIVGVLVMRGTMPGKKMLQGFFLAPAFATTSIAAAVVHPLWDLFGVAFKSGAFVFGTGLAIVPLLIHDVVNVHHWLTREQFMDALAFGQITPGPVVITITFIGYKVAGLLGAVLGTIGIFLPAFINILTWFPYAEKKLSKSPYTRAFILWAVAAVVGSIVVALVRLSLSPSQVGTHLMSWGLGLAAFLVTLLTSTPVWITIPAGGLLAFLFL